MFTFNAPYLPWVILGFGLMLGQSPVFDLLGILIGHIYFYLEDVLPGMIGRRILVTPTVMCALPLPCTRRSPMPVGCCSLRTCSRFGAFYSRLGRQRAARTIPLPSWTKRSASSRKPNGSSR